MIRKPPPHLLSQPNNHEQPNQSHTMTWSLNPLPCPALLPQLLISPLFSSNTYLSPLRLNNKRGAGPMVEWLPVPIQAAIIRPSWGRHVTKWFERQFDPGVRVWERTKSSVTWTLVVGEVVFVVWGGWLIVGSIPNCADPFFWRTDKAEGLQSHVIDCAVGLWGGMCRYYFVPWQYQSHKRFKSCSKLRALTRSITKSFL